MSMASLYDCPRFSHCNAPVCPLWPESLRGPHRREEAICPFLMEAVKPNGEAVLRGLLPDHLVWGVLEATPTALSLGGDLSRRLRRAKKQGSQAEAAARARQARARRRPRGKA